MRVLMIVTGFPSDENRTRSGFNYRAFTQLSDLNQVSVLKISTIKPLRPIIRKIKYSGLDYNEISLPVLPYRFFFLNNTIILRFLQNLVLNNNKIIPILQNIDITHAVGGGASAQIAYLIYKKIHIPYIVQYIGSDLNIYLNDNIIRKAQKNVIKNAFYHVFNSKSLQATFQDLFPGNNNTKVIYRGVDLREFRFRYNDSDIFIILFLGGFTNGLKNSNKYNLKGGVTLLKAWSILSKEPDFKHQLYFGGPDSDDAKIYQELKIKKESLKNIHFIGNISVTEVKELMQMSHIVIIPSFSEGLPNVMLEAMASGNLVIASNVGGIPEVIEHENSGLLIDEINDQKLYLTFLEILNNPAKVKEIALAARERIGRFSNINFGKDYTELYKMAVQNSSKV